MRIATAQQMAAIDRETIDSGIPGEELMENAGREMVRRSLDLFGELAPPARVVICCGKGNNGGDGLVMARLFNGLGFEVSVMLLALPEDLPADARLNHDRLPNTVQLVSYPTSEWAFRWSELAAGADLAVDAVFGTGIRPPVRGDYVGLFRAFNELPTPVLSVDIPSGVCGDTGLVDPVAVRANVTITVGLPKIGLLLPPGRDCTGDLDVIDIGFTPEVSDRHTQDLSYLTPDDYAGLLPPRASDAHKYQCGTVLVVAGSRAFGGAAQLAGQGALRSGAGLVSVAAPSCLEIPLRCGLPEALVTALDMTTAGTIAPLPPEVISALLHRRQAVAIGPGLADDPATDEFVVSWLRQLTLPVVVDADALSAFARTGTEPRFGSSQVVLTPHAGEFGRMVGIPPAEVTARKLELAPKLARQWGVTVLLKGSPAVIAAADGSVVLNAAGDDSLAHGGTGDVLTGLIGGLLAQDCSGRDAAVLGAYLHAKAGQNAALYGARRSVLAREVADNLGEVLADLEDLTA